MSMLFKFFPQIAADSDRIPFFIIVCAHQTSQNAEASKWDFLKTCLHLFTFDQLAISN